MIDLGALDPDHTGPKMIAELAARAPVLAALDLGTNNCRLLIARVSRGGYRVIDAFSRIVRLGEGLSRSDRLSLSAMARTLSALEVCGEKIRRRGAGMVRAVATEACRRAVNCGDFLDLVARETGIRIEIISSSEEGRLALAGCAPLLDDRVPHALVFDIGGGSTELMWLALERARQPTVIDQVSLKRGVVGLVEDFGGDRLSPETYRRMVAETAAEMTEFAARNDIARALGCGHAQVLGTSGTVTTLAGLSLGLARYQRSLVDGSTLSVTRARDLIRTLIALDFDGRAAHPCIGHDRADLIVAGCAVFEAIVTVMPHDQVRIADRGIREGILAELIDRVSPERPRARAT